MREYCYVSGKYNCTETCCQKPEKKRRLELPLINLIIGRLIREGVKEFCISNDHTTLDVTYNDCHNERYYLAVQKEVTIGSVKIT